mgnify:CR=1 FL=1
MNNIQGLVGQYYSKDWISRNILNQSTEERIDQFKQIQREKESGIQSSEEEGGF